MSAPNAVAREPRGCPTPGACSCLDPAPPADVAAAHPAWSSADALGHAVRAIPLEDKVWAVDVFGCAFIHDPDTQEGAELIAAEIKKNLLATVTALVAAERERCAQVCIAFPILAQAIRQAPRP